jgi:hypothetical protein
MSIIRVTGEVTCFDATMGSTSRPIDSGRTCSERSRPVKFIFGVPGGRELEIASSLGCE